MFKISNLLWPSLVLLLVSCAGSHYSSVGSSIDTNSSDITTNKPDSDLLYDEFFNPTSDIKFDLKFSNEAIYKLAKYSTDEVKKEMYHPCTLTITMNGTEYEFLEAGARMKGNTSRNPNFVDENGHFSGAIHFKISLKETFDDAEDNDYYIRTWDNDEQREARKDREFAKQQKFDIKFNKSMDYTFTKQAYAYNAFEEVGVMASKVMLIDTYIHSENDTLHQVYQLQEDISKDFLKARISKDAAKGNLYKSTYTDMGPASLEKTTLNSIGVEAPNYHPSYDLKTNDDPDEIDHTLLTNLINLVNDDTSDSDTFKNKIDKLVDVDKILRYQAMCWVMGNPDDSRNNANNYYIYFNSLTNKAEFIPYDFDRCLGILHEWEVHMEDVPLFTTKQNLLGYRPWQPNPLLWRLIINESDESVDYSEKWPVIKEYQDLYVQYCIDFAETYLVPEKFDAYTKQFIYANHDTSTGGSNNLTFEEYSQHKIQTLYDYGYIQK